MDFYAMLAVMMVAAEIAAIVPLVMRHRERMEKIRHGIDPDANGPCDDATEESLC
jgi:hypothetical protein